MSDPHNTGLDSTDQQAVNELLREFEENPFEARRTPADVMRIFFQFNVPVLPVVSRRGILIGVITKEAITAEMSDIDRCNEQKIDEFVTRVARPMTFEALLPYLAAHASFSVINIFGEVQGNWSRLELIRAVDAPHSCAESVVQNEVDEQLERQSMEWMIYFILEHIPRALYAMNTDGKTIFYNSYFEDIVLKAFETDDIDVALLERVLGDKAINDVRVAGGRDGIVTFYNRRLEIEYEKVPMFSRGVAVGYLVYVSGDAPADERLCPARVCRSKCA
jgi:CBS domain-containing protein